MIDPLEKRLTGLLTEHGVTQNIIEMYLDEIFAFSDRKLYEDADDHTIIVDFDKWLEIE